MLSDGLSRKHAKYDTAKHASGHELREMTSQRTRHIETRYFKIRDYVRNLYIRVRHIGTDFNVSDFFTKALARNKFQEYRNYLGMEDHTPF